MLIGQQRIIPLHIEDISVAFKVARGCLRHSAQSHGHRSILRYLIILSPHASSNLLAVDGMKKFNNAYQHSCNFKYFGY